MTEFFIDRVIKKLEKKLEKTAKSTSFFGKMRHNALMGYYRNLINWWQENEFIKREKEKLEKS